MKAGDKLIHKGVELTLKLDPKQSIRYREGDWRIYFYGLAEDSEGYHYFIQWDDIDELKINKDDPHFIEIPDDFLINDKDGDEGPNPFYDINRRFYEKACEWDRFVIQ